MKRFFIIVFLIYTAIKACIFYKTVGTTFLYEEKQNPESF
jgi:hypothetical protein